MYLRKLEDANYIILEAFNRRELENDVSEAMKDGFEPLGGVCYTFRPGMTYSDSYCQAMIRRRNTVEI